MKLYNERFENVLPGLEPKYHGVATDPPYNISEPDIIGSESKMVNLTGRRAIQKHMGNWDEGFVPDTFVEMSERILLPGGWLVIFTSDKLLGEYHRLITEHENLFYKATITWIKPNPVPQLRHQNFLSACEYISLAIKGDGGEKIPPVSFNWFGQANMKNFFVEPICSGSERLYWHYVDEEIIPCQRDCHLCKEEESHRHPTQKPMRAWKWLYERLFERGQSIIDPFAGTGSSGAQAINYGLDWTGIEMSKEFFLVAQKWLSGRWGISEEQITLEDIWKSET